MNEVQLGQVQEQLPAGESLCRLYRAVEGDLRIVTRNANGSEKRYTVSFDAEGNVTIHPF